ncbi:hypothetical protein FDP41_005969 [Naegleria fowleri]|uniref:Uncharacterized protein n=1 Tax=Naegleria fowleri TaxID=5763 RepID=A0A6A5BK10_NAEFO|nr:uncharacterized protein FDP41_005969 [Naegleria fowleri]KAF0975216.1 hypothetical protein FDP41_005969 [Naegleria fowleri]CAG4711636.1 unnamed protein product [Naegleria fowleri]
MSSKITLSLPTSKSTSLSPSSSPSLTTTTHQEGSSFKNNNLSLLGRIRQLRKSEQKRKTVGEANTTITIIISSSSTTRTTTMERSFSTTSLHSSSYHPQALSSSFNNSMKEEKDQHVVYQGIKKSKRKAFTPKRDAVKMLSSFSSHQHKRPLLNSKPMMEKLTQFEMPRLDYVTRESLSSSSIEQDQTNSLAQESREHTTHGYVSTNPIMESSLTTTSKISELLQPTLNDEELEKMLEEANRIEDPSTRHSHPERNEKEKKHNDPFVDTQQYSEYEDLEKEISETAHSEHEGYIILSDDDEDHEQEDLEKEMNKIIDSEVSDDDFICMSNFPKTPVTQKFKTTNVTIHENKKSVLVKREGHSDMTLWIPLDLSFQKIKQHICETLRKQPNEYILSIFDDDQFEQRRFITVEDLCEWFQIDKKDDSQKLEFTLRPKRSH